MKAMIPDDPIASKEKDLLHRYPLASRIAGMIGRFEDSDSIVIGIEGEWGSGKTSFVNMILEDLRKTRALLIKFNPWNFSDQNELIKDFFDALIEAIKQADGKGGEAKANKIKEYAAKLMKRGGITLAPEISALGIASLKLGEFNILGGEEPLEKQKETINKLLKEFGKRIVIVIDDIDRLDSYETKLIFKLVKMTANFANTIFLLAYDRGKVCERMNENGIKGEEYLKKIIQVSFTLPRPDPQDLFRILFSDIDASIQGFDDKYWDEVRWGNLFHSGLKHLFPTVRDIKRYISGLRLDLAIIGNEEVNPIDFLGIEAIRVFAPDVYLAIADEKLAFTTTASSFVGGGDGRARDDRKGICEHILTEKSPSGLADAMREIVQQLFPQVAGLYTNTYYGYEWQQEWRKQLRVCAEDIFDKYFSLSVPTNTLSEKSLKEFLAAITNLPALADNLKKFQEENKLRLVLDRLLDQLDDLTEQQKENLLIGVFDFMQDVKDIRLGMFDLQDVDTETMRLGYQTLKRVAKEKRVAFLTNILSSTNGIYAPIHLVTVLNQELEKQEKKESQDEPLVSQEDIGRINQVCINKLRAAAKDGTLATSKHLAHLLFAWKDWESEAPVKEYVSVIIKTTAGVVALLKGFEGEGFSQTIGDYVGRRTKKIDKEALAVFIDIGELDKRVREISKARLSPENKETLTLYLNPPKDRV